MAPRKPANSGKDWTRGEVGAAEEGAEVQYAHSDGRVTPEAHTRCRAAEGEQPRPFHEADEKELIRHRREAPRPVGPPAGGRRGQRLQSSASWGALQSFPK